MVVTDNSFSLTAVVSLYIVKRFQHISDLLGYYFTGAEYYNLVS